MHLAFPVNFNLRLECFKDSIELTQGLTELLMDSRSRVGMERPVFMFASSVATLARYPGPEDEWVDEKPVDVLSCIGSGYGESKMVCEKVRVNLFKHSWVVKMLHLVVMLP